MPRKTPKLFENQVAVQTKVFHSYDDAFSSAIAIIFKGLKGMQAPPGSGAKAGHVKVVERPFKHGRLCFSLLPPGSSDIHSEQDTPASSRATSPKRSTTAQHDSDDIWNQLLTPSQDRDSRRRTTFHEGNDSKGLITAAMVGDINDSAAGAARELDAQLSRKDMADGNRSRRQSFTAEAFDRQNSRRGVASRRQSQIDFGDLNQAPGSLSRTSTCQRTQDAGDESRRVSTSGRRVSMAGGGIEAVLLQKQSPSGDGHSRVDGALLDLWDMECRDAILEQNIRTCLRAAKVAASSPQSRLTTPSHATRAAAHHEGGNNKNQSDTFFTPIDELRQSLDSAMMLRSQGNVGHGHSVMHHRGQHVDSHHHHHHHHPQHDRSSSAGHVRVSCGGGGHAWRPGTADAAGNPNDSPTRRRHEYYRQMLECRQYSPGLDVPDSRVLESAAAQQQQQPGNAAWLSGSRQRGSSRCGNPSATACFLAPAPFLMGVSMCDLETLASVPTVTEMVAAKMWHPSTQSQTGGNGGNSKSQDPRASGQRTSTAGGKAVAAVGRADLMRVLRSQERQRQQNPEHDEQNFLVDLYSSRQLMSARDAIRMRAEFVAARRSPAFAHDGRPLTAGAAEGYGVGSQSMAGGRQGVPRLLTGDVRRSPSMSADMSTTTSQDPKYKYFRASGVVVSNAQAWFQEVGGRAASWQSVNVKDVGIPGASQRGASRQQQQQPRHGSYRPNSSRSKHNSPRFAAPRKTGASSPRRNDESSPQRNDVVASPRRDEISSARRPDASSPRKNDASSPRRNDGSQVNGAHTGHAPPGHGAFDTSSATGIDHNYWLSKSGMMSDDWKPKHTAAQAASPPRHNTAQETPLEAQSLGAKCKAKSKGATSPSHSFTTSKVKLASSAAACPPGMRGVHVQDMDKSITSHLTVKVCQENNAHMFRRLSEQYRGEVPQQEVPAPVQEECNEQQQEVEGAAQQDTTPVEGEIVAA